MIITNARRAAPLNDSDGGQREALEMFAVRGGVGALLVALGLFWVGRESDHGWSALWEHWWCPIPLVMVAVGFALVLLGRLPGRPGHTA